jgi:hypothetical protein
MTLPNWLLLAGMISSAYIGNLLAWLTVWTWRKARVYDRPKPDPHAVENLRQAAMSTRSEDVRWAEADAETEARYRKENAPMEGRPLTHRANAGPTVVREAPHANRLLVPPPKVDGVTLRDWAIHYTHRADIWESFVTDFYETAAGDPDVLQVFKDAAARRGIGAAELMADVQNHFLRALLILTHTGLTERLAASLAERHFALGLTPYVYDRTADALVAVATRYGVPTNAMKTLGQMIAELKPRLVTA